MILYLTGFYLQDLQDLLDNYSQGAIYFSLGTMTKSDSFHPDKLNAILKVFESIPQLVLWKCDGANLPHVPKNVWTSKWFPQNDILSKFKPENLVLKFVI